MGKICTFCQYRKPNNKCRLIESNASVEHTERCTCYEPADVAPVVHAHWTYEIDDLFPEDSMMICSNCGEYERLGANDNYCGNCGAKMDEGEL